MIEIYIDKILANIPQKFWLFPAGEVGINLDFTPQYAEQLRNAKSVTFLARIKNSNDFFELAQVVDAVRQYCLAAVIKIPVLNLILPYIPYSRQDRVCAKGDSFSLKVFANLINSLEFERVVVADPHSNISVSLINNCVALSQFNIVDKTQYLRTTLGAGIFVAPDEGSIKKTSELAKYFNHERFVPASKIRNLSTGQILGISVQENDFKGRDVVVCDDICDGGFTFTLLAQELNKRNVGKISLFVVFGIFSKGLRCLYEGGISEVITTDAFSTSTPNDAVEGKFTQVSITKLMLDLIP